MAGWQNRIPAEIQSSNTAGLVMPSCRRLRCYMAKIITVANLKGGVGKSTLSTNIACALAGDRKVTLVDADDHQATSWWGPKAPPPVPVISARFDTQEEKSWGQRVLELDGDLVVAYVGGGQVKAVTIARPIADVALSRTSPNQ